MMVGRLYRWSIARFVTGDFLQVRLSSVSWTLIVAFSVGLVCINLFSAWLLYAADSATFRADDSAVGWMVITNKVSHHGDDEAPNTRRVGGAVNARATCRLRQPCWCARHGRTSPAPSCLLLPSAASAPSGAAGNVACLTAFACSCDDHSGCCQEHPSPFRPASASVVARASLVCPLALQLRVSSR